MLYAFRLNKAIKVSSVHTEEGVKTLLKDSLYIEGRWLRST